MIRRETNGKGVDLVLNSLSDDKLQASVRCLAYRGRFLEIGKFDISNNTPIGMYFFLKETSFHGIMLDYIFDQSFDFRLRLQNLLLAGIESGAVRPLTYCTFEKHEVETAFRYMAAGKHIGKVIIKIRDDERSHRTVKPSNLLIDAAPR
ncbi:fatty acid synthase-like [Choristoneura fumiferana]|uniref:fatty acid synthase-like n=1 Tax=Choristoneura fumiferana TaxID=7141 RepID=UPI003D15EF79